MKLPFLHNSGSKPTLGERLGQLAMLGALVLVVLYTGGIATGYYWLSHIRKLEQVSVVDVAFFRVQHVRRAMALQQFARAQAEWDAKNYQAAYVAFSTGLRQDPDNIPGRLAAAGFFRAVGAANLGQAMLEEGLANAPGDQRLIESTFNLLLSTGHDRHALELLHKTYPPDFAGPNELLLQTYELQATLSVEGPGAARRLLAQHAGLDAHPLAAPVVARVLWESAERLKAISLLADYLRAAPAVFADYYELATWQAAANQPVAAIRTAEQAGVKFPADLAPRVLLIEAQAAAAPDGRPRPAEIESYLRNYSSRPEAIPRLAALAANHGWVDLARILYDLGAVRQSNLAVLALYYSDALARHGRFNEVQPILSEIEAQTPEDSSAPFLIQLRQRQIIAAGALGQTAAVHDFARRLGALLGNDPDGLENYRRLFLRLNLPDAVAELTPRVAAKPAVRK